MILTESFLRQTSWLMALAARGLTPYILPYSCGVSLLPATSSRFDTERLFVNPRGPFSISDPEAVHRASCGLQVQTSVNLKNPSGVG